MLRSGYIIGVVLGLAIDGAQAQPPVTPIVGGTATATGEYPTVVAIQLDVPSGGLCSGTLIDPEWVLTAAHCLVPSFQGFPSQAALTAATTVILDAIDASSGGLRVAASETIPHPAFDLTMLGDNDVGLVRLATTVDRIVSPVNDAADRAPVGIAIDVVGYGQTSTASTAAGIQHALRDRSSVSCTTYGGSDVTLLCTPAVDGSRCTGDSGGPSFAQLDGVTTVVGVASFVGTDCGVFNADSRTDAEYDFIAEHVGSRLACEHDGACNAACGEAMLPADPDCSRDAGCDAGRGDAGLPALLAIAALIRRRRRG